MLIEIHSSVSNYLIDNSESLDCLDNEIVALNALALSWFHGKHIVIASINILENLKSFELLSELARRVFTSLYGLAYSFNYFKESVNTCLVIYKGIPPKKENNCHYTSIDNCMEVRESVLVCENLNDCSFYFNLCQSLLLEKKEENISIKYRFSSCHGSHAYSVLENELSDNNFVFAIMDSDKKYVNDKIGTSAKSADKIYNQKKEEKVLGLLVLGVRTKENVVPPSLLSLCLHLNESKMLLEILNQIEDQGGDDFLRFFNVKEGMKIKDFHEINNLEYGMFIKKIMDYLECMYPTKDMIEKDPDAKVFNGIGGEYINNFEKDILKHGLECRRMQICKRFGEKSNTLIDLNKTLTEKIEKSYKLYQLAPKYIKIEWDKIYKSVLSFGCCAPKKFREMIY